MIIITALFAFEMFNYSTTEFALTDLLGDLRFAGIRWATILAIAFCGIDFAGIARLFTPQDENESGPAVHYGTWYLFGAWLLAATMNAMLTWWGVSLAILGHETLGSAVMERTTLLRVVPIFVALLVWLIRVLIIGTFSAAGSSVFGKDDLRLVKRARPQTRPSSIPAAPTVISAGAGAKSPTASAPAAFASRPPLVRPKPQSSTFSRLPRQSDSPQGEMGGSGHPEPTYHPMSASGLAQPKSQPSIDPEKSNSTYRH